MMKKLFICLIGMIFLVATSVFAANYNVDSFECSPEESELGSTFSCEATLIDAEMGSTAFTGTAKLVPDPGWSDDSEYEKTVSASWSVQWTGLRSTSAGENGFYRVYLGDEEDTYVADSAYSVNIISLALSLEVTSSSVASGARVNITPTVTAGGELSDVAVTIAAGSGCSVSGSSSQSIGDMSDGSVVSKQPWAITISEDCSYTVTVTGNGDRDVATTSDASSGSIDCSDCVTPDGGSTSGGGGGGSSTKATYDAGVLSSDVSYDLALEESVSFSVGDESHTLKITNLSDIGVVLTISSDVQELELLVGEEKGVNFDSDVQDEILVRLGSIDIVNKKARITIRPVITSTSGTGGQGGKGGESGEEGIGEKIGDGIGKLGEGIKELFEKKSARTIFWVLIGLLVLLVVVLIVAELFFKRKSEGQAKKRYYEF